MPHMNNLDLAVFPAMSKRHSDLLRIYSSSVADAEEIWKAALNVWTSMESATIARGYLLAYRIAEKVIRANGSNAFLREKDLHCGVRNDFANTAEGITKKIIVTY
jgi:hypothetical protein